MKNQIYTHLKNQGLVWMRMDRLGEAYVALVDRMALGVLSSCNWNMDKCYSTPTGKDCESARDTYYPRNKDRVRMHTLVAESYICPRPGDLVCHHKNGRRWDNTIENLAWITRSENCKRLHRDEPVLKTLKSVQDEKLASLDAE